MLQPVGFRQQGFILADLIISGQRYGIFNAFRRRYRIGRTPDIMEVFPGSTPCQVIGYLPDLLFPHATYQKVGAAIRQNGGKQFVLPVIIMGKTAKAGLDAADDNRQVGPDFFNNFCIDKGSVIRPFPHGLARGIFIFGAGFPGRRVMAQHGIQIAPADQHPQPGFTHDPESIRAAPVGLGQNRYFIPCRFQNTADHSRRKRRMIHVGIPADKQEIQLLPASFLHILFANRQKFLIHFVSFPAES